MATHWDILGIGNAAVDELIFMNGFPQPDTKMPAQEIQRQGGGLAATALVAAARQGAKTAFCSLIGTDELSAFTLADLHREGVDTTACLTTPEGRPYHAFVLVDSLHNTRTIIYQTGKVDPPANLITTELVTACRMLFIDHHAPVAGIRAAEIARAHGIPVVADIENENFPEVKEFIRLTDHLIIGANFARRLTHQIQPQDMLRSLIPAARIITVVTVGDQGCYFAIGDGSIQHQPADRVPIVDTTGCGDVFHGAYMAAVLRGEILPRALRLATASAALKAGSPGARAGIPTLQAVLDFVEQRDS